MTKAFNKTVFNFNKKLLKEKLSDSEACPYCNCLMEKETNSSYSVMSIDHVVASAKGGTDEIDNLIACCANCNSRKGDSERILLPLFKESRVLSDEEYRKVNFYLNLELRIYWAKEIKELIINKNYEKALKACSFGEKNSPSKSFFEHARKGIKSIMNDKKNENKVLKKIVNDLRDDIQKYYEVKEETEFLGFSIYTLIA